MTDKQTSFNKNTLAGMLSILSLTFIVFLFSFPKLYPVIETGLDGSANFAFNYFFANGIQTGVDVVFTYGPLGFLKAPLPVGNNLVYAIIFLSFIRLLFVFLLLYLGRIINPQKWLTQFLITLGIAMFVSFDLCILGVIILSLLICHEKRCSGLSFFVAILFTVLSMLIKASIGINSLLIMISYLVLTFSSNRSFKPLLIFAGGALVLFIVFWIMIYGNFQGMFKYFYGTFQLVRGNSSAVALHPYNNWYIVILSLLIFFYLPFSVKERKIFFLYGILFLSVFAFWKYSFSREENFHVKSLLDYMILIFAIILVYAKNIRALQIILMGVCMMLYYRNMELTDKYKIDDRVNFIGINNFLDATTGYEDWTESCNNQSQRNIMPNKLENDPAKYIDYRTIDIYPWDYSYVAANDLNWRPRPVIQSYAVYTSWLDKINAEHFASENSPEFILWELFSRINSDEFGGVDERYLLNDEPRSVLEIFNRYDIVKKEREFLLLEKGEDNNLNGTEIIATEVTEWNRWVKVPEVEDGILRARLNCRGNFLRFLRNSVYKDAAFFVEYKMGNGDVIKYRIVPDNAKDGIWVNPFLKNVSDEYLEPLVSEVRFSNSVNSIMRDQIGIEWELTKVKSDGSVIDSTLIGKRFVYANKMFGKYLIPNQMVRSYNDFEEAYNGWSENRKKLSELLSYSPGHSVKLDTSDRFSPSYSISVGELEFPPSSTINVKANVFVYLTNGAEGNIVITVQNGKNMKYWNAVNLNEFSVPNIWNKVTLDKNLPQHLVPSDVIKLYVWNTGNNDLYVDDFEIKIESVR